MKFLETKGRRPLVSDPRLDLPAMGGNVGRYETKALLLLRNLKFAELGRGTKYAMSIFNVLLEASRNAERQPMC